MIYDENGIIMNDESNILEFLNRETKLDALLQEAITFKDIKQGVAYFVNSILDKIQAFIDWLERLKYRKEIKQIKQNKDRVIQILKEMYKEDDYAKSIKGEIAKYLNASGCMMWSFQLGKAFSLMKNTKMTIDELEDILYKDIIGKNISKDIFFKNEKSTDTDTKDISNMANDIVEIAITVSDEISELRRIYSTLKAFNFSQNKDDKISKDAMQYIHSYVIKGISASKNLSSLSIELCTKALNLDEKYSGDISKIRDDISTYDLSKDIATSYVDRWDFKKIKNPDYETQLEILKKNASYIKYIENPTEEMQLIVVNKDPFNINYIKNPTEKVIRTAMNHKFFSAYLLKNIELPENIQFDIINKDPSDFDYIKNPTEKVSLEAVKLNSYNIHHIENPTEEMQLIVAKDHISYSTVIKNPTDKVVQCIIDNHSDEEIKKFFKKFSKEMQNKFIKKDPKYKEYLK